MTSTETPEQRYDRLSTEYRRLRHIHSDDRTDADRTRLVALTLELRKLLAVPPSGYTLPTTAADLIAHAHAHGWDAWAQWTSDTGTSGGPFVTVHVGRRQSPAAGDFWRYELIWHSRGCPVGRVRRFGHGIAQTPDNPAPRGTPSVRSIRQVIAQHPAPGDES
jgi:hypothetical protein